MYQLHKIHLNSFPTDQIHVKTHRAKSSTDICHITECKKQWRMPSIYYKRPKFHTWKKYKIYLMAVWHGLKLLPRTKKPSSATHHHPHGAKARWLTPAFLDIHEQRSFYDAVWNVWQRWWWFLRKLKCCLYKWMQVLFCSNSADLCSIEVKFKFCKAAAAFWLRDHIPKASTLLGSSRTAPAFDLYLKRNCCWENIPCLETR